MPLDALYGMLKVLGIDASDPGQIEAQLKAGAERLKALMERRTGATLTDVELVRLAGLADEAQAEGAIDVALELPRTGERAGRCARTTGRCQRGQPQGRTGCRSARPMPSMRSRPR